MKIIISTAVVVMALLIGYKTYNTQNEKKLTGIALANVEALATDVDYIVPQKNNNPKKCYLYVRLASSSTLSTDDEIVIQGGIEFIKTSGIENVCETPKGDQVATGCDPYECHKRVS